MQRFQTLQDPLAPIVPPYHRVPQLNFSGELQRCRRRRSTRRCPAEYVQLHAPDAGRRRARSLSPTFATPLLAPGWFVTPKVGLALTRLQPRAHRHSASRRRRASRCPWVERRQRPGLRARRDWFGAAAARRRSSRALFYVYVPYRNQDQHPALRHGARRLQLRAALHREPLRRRRPLRRRQPADARAHLALPATERARRRCARRSAQRFYFDDERVGAHADFAAAHTQRVRPAGLASAGASSAHWTFDATTQYNPHEQRAERSRSRRATRPSPRRC